eukprot:3612571-Prorocentrum_lima.AAC.1
MGCFPVYSPTVEDEVPSLWAHGTPRFRPGWVYYPDEFPGGPFSWILALGQVLWRSPRVWPLP